MGKSLLVVDDSATMRKIIVRSIREAGLAVDGEIREAGDGNEALEQINTAPADVVLCNINMPGMGGLEFVKAARKLPTCSSTKIVMISAESAEELIDSVTADGADGYVTKPFTPETIQKELSPFMSLSVGGAVKL